MDLSLLAPELVLGTAALVVIAVDALYRRSGLTVALSLAGIGLATLAAGGLLLRDDLPQNSFAGMLLVDNFALFFKFLFLGIAALVVLSSGRYSQRFAAFRGEYYGLVMLSAGGMMLMAATAELISIYISLELTGISLYVLAGFLKDRKSSEAGLKFLLLGAIASAVLLYGMALVFGLTGSTHLESIGPAIHEVVVGNRLALLVAVVLLAGGFGFKLAMVPFQMWVPDVYEGAPTPVTAYLSVASKAAGFAVVLRVFHAALGDPAISVDWAALFAVLAAVTMSLGNLVAVTQNNIKRLFGYSSVAQAGYLLVGVAAVSGRDPSTLLGVSGVTFFLAAYSLTNLGAFIAIIAITNKTECDDIQSFSGMARRAPLVAFVLTFCLLSLTGIPPTAGFVAKFYIFNAAVQNDLVWLVLIGVVNSVVSAYYYLRVVKVMYVGEPESEDPVPAEGPLRLALVVAGLGVLLLGVVPSPFIRAAEVAAAALTP